MFLVLVVSNTTSKYVFCVLKYSLHNHCQWPSKTVGALLELSTRFIPLYHSQSQTYIHTFMN